MSSVFSLLPGQESKKDLCLISLHGDEKVAKEICRRVQTTLNCGAVIFNGTARQARFKNELGEFNFDPNRIWTAHRLGQLKEINLNLYCDFRQQVYWPIREFVKEFKAVVALHNNGKSRFSLDSFVAGDLKEYTRRWFRAEPPAEPGDFFLVTKEKDFKKISQKNFNVVLQNFLAREDGSLSMFLQNKRFFNIETKARLDISETINVQLKMLVVVLRLLRE